MYWHTYLAFENLFVSLPVISNGLVFFESDSLEEHLQIWMQFCCIYQRLGEHFRLA
jgi:hypothetical protein